MLTRVELLFLEGRIERWIRFGRWTEEVRLDRRTRVVGFAPGGVFAFVRWQAGDYGTALSRLDIVRAVGEGEAFTTLPGVTPGGEILARIEGWPRVSRALAAIDAVEAVGVAAPDAAPDHWRHVGGRLAAGMAPRPYTRFRHRAWRLRAELAR